MSPDGDDLLLAMSAGRVDARRFKAAECRAFGYSAIPHHDAGAGVMRWRRGTRGWRPVEFVMNTPSHHRVHHASDPEYLDKNYAGMLIIWDRMFGTFVDPETMPDTFPLGLGEQVEARNIPRMLMGV